MYCDVIYKTKRNAERCRKIWADTLEEAEEIANAKYPTWIDLKIHDTYNYFTEVVGHDKTRI